MKAISLWQPWATLMAIGTKKIETRPWGTSYRGPLAIHAAKKWDAELLGICTEPYFEEVLMQEFRCTTRRHLEVELPTRLPFGAFVAVVDLHDCVGIEDCTIPDDPHEYAFGDYTRDAGRFALKTRDRVRLPRPIPYRGAQRLFNVPDAMFADVIDKVRAVS